MSVFVRKSSNLHGHAMAAAASSGGLWSEAPIGAFDDYALSSTVDGRDLVVLRSQARLIIGDDRAGTIAAAVSTAVQTSDASTSSITWGVPADDPDALITKALENVTSQSEWMRRPRNLQSLQKQQISLGTLLHNWAIFQMRLPLAAVHFFGSRARSTVEKSLTKATVGSEAGVVGRVVPLSPDEAAKIAEARLQGLSHQLAPDRLKQEASHWGQTTPTAWRHLRELCIALVDGSTLPGSFIRSRRGGFDEVLLPTHITPDPLDAMPASAGKPVPAVDVEGVAERLKGQDETESGSPPVTDPDCPETVDGNENDGIIEWVARRKSSLMWRLATHVYELRRAEDTSANRALSRAMDASAPDTKSLKAAQALLVLSWAASLLGIVLILGWIGVKSAFESLPLPAISIQNASVAVLFVLLCLLAGGSQYFRTLRGYEWKVLEHLHRLRTASDEYVIATQEERRWRVMYRGVLEWGEILGQLMHHPWAVPADDVEASPSSYDGLPASVAIARPVGGDAFPSSAVLISGVEAVCHRGWLEKEFDRYVTLSPLNNQTTESRSGDLPADLDLGLRSHGPRADLVRIASTPSTRQAAAQHLAADVRALITKGDLRLPDQKVVRLGPYSSGDAVTDHAFFTASMHIQAPLTADLFTPAAEVARRHVPQKTLFCLPLGTPLMPDFDGAEIVHSGATIALRVDISPQLQPSDVRIFARQAPVHRQQVDDVDDYN